MLTIDELKKGFYGHDKTGKYSNLLVSDADEVMEDAFLSVLNKNMDKEKLLNKLNDIAYSLEMFETNIAIKKLRELFKIILFRKEKV